MDNSNNTRVLSQISPNKPESIEKPLPKEHDLPSKDQEDTTNKPNIPLRSEPMEDDIKIESEFKEASLKPRTDALPLSVLIGNKDNSNLNTESEHNMNDHKMLLDLLSDTETDDISAIPLARGPGLLALNRKSDEFVEYKLTANQRWMCQSPIFLQKLKKAIAHLGKPKFQPYRHSLFIKFNGFSSTSEFVCKGIIEKKFGSAVEILDANASPFILKFPLTNNHLKEMNKIDITSQFEKEMNGYGSFAIADDCSKELIVTVPIIRAPIHCVYWLQRYIGTLIEWSELRYLMQRMGRSADDIAKKDVCLEFWEEMLGKLESGHCFTRHQKNRSPTQRWIVVRKCRLHWKVNQSDRNQGSRCFFFRNFRFVTPGKATKALKAALDIEESNCFTIGATVDSKDDSHSSTKTLDLSAEKASDCFIWLILLNALHIHYENSRRELEAARNPV